MAEDIADKRGPKYPSDSLRVAIDLIGKVREGIGFSAASSDTIVKALGYETLNGTSKRKLGVLNHYGFLDRTSAGTYKISELAKRVLIPTDAFDRELAVTEAAKTPRLFQQIFERFSGHALPNLFTNLLVRDFGVAVDSGEQVAAVFKDSAEFAGLLRNGVLSSTPEADPEPTPAISAEPRRDASRAEALPLPAPAAQAPGAQRYTVALDGAGRVAQIDLPVPVRARDLTALVGWLNYMRLVAEQEEPPAISAN